MIGGNSYNKVLIPSFVLTVLGVLIYAPMLMIAHNAEALISLVWYCVAMVIINVVMALIVCKTVKEVLFAVLLMPTNYFVLFMPFVINSYVQAFIV